jgi:vesicle coat complex subunit
MVFDPTIIDKVNVIDTCSIWNMISSDLLFSRSITRGCAYACTEYVKYESLLKPRKNKSTYDTAFQDKLSSYLSNNSIKVCSLSIDDLLDVQLLENRRKLGMGELSSIAFARKIEHAFLTDDMKAKKLAIEVLGGTSISAAGSL